MAALSIPLVIAEAHKSVSPHLSLIRVSQSSCFEWVYSDGTRRSVQRVPVDKIRGLKMAEWLRYAKTLVGGEAIPDAPPVELNAAIPSKPAGPAGGPAPSFMLLKNKSVPIPFDPDPVVQGYRDATRGISACPYSVADKVAKWNEGYDQAYADGKTEKRQFGKNRKNVR